MYLGDLRMSCAQVACFIQVDERFHDPFGIMLHASSRMFVRRHDSRSVQQKGEISVILMEPNQEHPFMATVVR
jgi:hypothetical protein